SSRSFFGESSRDFFERPPSVDGIKHCANKYAPTNGGANGCGWGGRKQGHERGLRPGPPAGPQAAIPSIPAYHWGMERTPPRSLSLSLTSTPAATDPVCGMTVDPAAAPGPHVHNGRSYYFCCSGCLHKFKVDPDR